MTASNDILKGAYDLHVHCAPDVVSRGDDLRSLARVACDSGMAGILIKDHNTSTVGRVAALNAYRSGECRFFSAVTLNDATGGITPAAVRAARRGASRGSEH
jgi:uncharacterized protein DUF6282